MKKKKDYVRAIGLIAIVCLCLLFWVGVIKVFAKEYKVEVDEKIVPYFEKAFVGEKVTPSEWLNMQAVNLADRGINQAYIKKIVEDKTRRQKIAEIEK